MSMGRTRLQGRTLTHDEFMRKHESELLESDKDSVTGGTISLGALMKGKDLPGPSETLPLPISALLVQLHRWWLVRLLGAAARENSPEAYGSLLGYWLHKMGVDPPAGVFLRAPGKPGRPPFCKDGGDLLDLDRSGQALALPPETGACGVPGRVHEGRQRRAEEDDRSMPTRRGALASPITTKPILNKS